MNSPASDYVAFSAGQRPDKVLGHGVAVDLSLVNV